MQVHLVDAKNPRGRIQRVECRRPNVEYYVEHHGGYLYILTNSGPSPNYRLVRCPIQTSASEFWEVLPFPNASCDSTEL
jgi:protease II